jgi:hypothetical protein
MHMNALSVNTRCLLPAHRRGCSLLSEQIIRQFALDPRELCICTPQAALHRLGEWLKQESTCLASGKSEFSPRKKNKEKEKKKNIYEISLCV